MQSELYKLMLAEIKRLDTNGDTVKVTVKNLSILASIKNKLNRLILNPEYKAEIKEFAKAFNQVYSLQFEYWKSVEATFKPKPLLKAIRNQAITDVVGQLTTQGISANVSDAIVGILRTNITAGGSYNDLAEQLRQSLTNTPESKGILDRYVKTVAKDSINQFSRQYMNIVSNDLGYEWYRYMNSDIETTRCFCDALTDKDYFHISEVPGLLKGKGLKCDGDPVPIYAKTGLPYGMIDGTNAENFFIRAGGWNCGHSIQPVNVRQVPEKTQGEVYATTEYKAWAEANGIIDKKKEGVIKDTADFEFSHSFVNDAGNKVTQYKVTGGYGGYARVEHDKSGFIIPNVIIDDRVQGKGIATNFYKKVNTESVKETGKTLQSIKPDSNGLIELSKDGQRLWDSLVKKGLANKLGEKRYRFIQ